jgi:hypothetical protein
MTTKLNKMIKGAALVGAMAFGLMLSTSTTASAQNRGWDRDDRYRQPNYGQQSYDRDRDRGATQAAYSRGYNDGLRAGEQAARGGRYSYGYENRNSGGYGNGYVQQSYQSGFSRGYQDGLNRSRGRRSGVTLRFPW